MESECSDQDRGGNTGSGGMGVVWLAWEERLERRVAVKCARLDDVRLLAQPRPDRDGAWPAHA